MFWKNNGEGAAINRQKRVGGRAQRSKASGKSSGQRVLVSDYLSIFCKIYFYKKAMVVVFWFRFWVHTISL